MKRPSPSGTGTWGSGAWSSFEQKSELSRCSLSPTWEELLPYHLSVALIDRSEKPQGKVEDSGVSGRQDTSFSQQSVLSWHPHSSRGAFNSVPYLFLSPLNIWTWVPNMVSKGAAQPNLGPGYLEDSLFPLLQ